MAGLIEFIIAVVAIVTLYALYRAFREMSGDGTPRGNGGAERTLRDEPDAGERSSLLEHADEPPVDDFL